MFNYILEENKTLMEKIFSKFKKKISKILTGRNSIKILDNILIDCYGVMTNLNKVSNITLKNHNTIKIDIYDISLINLIEEAIIKSKLNLTIYKSNKNIKVILPQLNEDRRKELIKIVSSEAENARIEIRKTRRIYNFKITQLNKKKKINKDEFKIMKNNIQEFTDIYVKKINLKLIKKEKELIKI